MNNKPIDKTKKSNIKCDHCRFSIIDKNATIAVDNSECTNSNSPKFGKGTISYWNRCKCFEWRE